MKTAIILIVLVFACLVRADVYSELDTAEKRANEAGEKLKNALFWQDVYQMGYKQMSEDRKADAQTIADLTAEKKAAERERDAERETGRKNLRRGMGVITGGCALVACLAFMAGNNRLAIRAAIAGAVCLSATLAIEYRYQEYAVYGLLSLVGLTVFGLVWIVIDWKRDHEKAKAEKADLTAAGVEHANMLPLIEHLPDISATVLARIKSLWWQETGPTADKLASIATGKPLDQLAREANQASGLIANEAPQ